MGIAVVASICPSVQEGSAHLKELEPESFACISTLAAGHHWLYPPTLGGGHAQG